MKRTTGVLIAVAGGIAGAAVIPPGVNGPGLAAVGPTAATDGFPVWYKDKAGVRLENCVALADPFCPARGAVPDETSPISFPDNYPDEGFYSLVDTGAITTSNGGKARAEVALERHRAAPHVDGNLTIASRARPTPTTSAVSRRARAGRKRPTATTVNPRSGCAGRRWA